MVYSKIKDLILSEDGQYAREICKNLMCYQREKDQCLTSIDLYKKIREVVKDCGESVELLYAIIVESARRAQTENWLVINDEEIEKMSIVEYVLEVAETDSYTITYNNNNKFIILKKV